MLRPSCGGDGARQQKQQPEKKCHATLKNLAAFSLISHDLEVFLSARAQQVSPEPNRSVR